MKKLIAVALAVALVITLFAVVGPVSAGPPDASERTVFEASLVPSPEIMWGPYESVTLDEGEVKVYADGGWEMKIKGLRVDEELFTEDLDLLFWTTSWYPVTLIDFLSQEDGQVYHKEPGGGLDSIPAGEYPGLHVYLTDGGVAWLVESGVIIE